MDLSDQMNQILDYIETHLSKNRNITELARVSGLTETAIQIIFPLLMGMGVKEYITKRIMTSAVSKLKEGQKVIDVAFDYGYTSPTSFSRAFYAFHQVKPKDVAKRNVVLSNYPRPILDIKKSISTPLTYQMIKNQAFFLYVLSIPVPDITKTPVYAQPFWEQVKAQYPEINASPKRFGFVYEKNNQVQYYIGTETPHVGFQTMNFPPTDYLVFEMNSSDGNAIRKQILESYETYLNSLHLQKKDSPILEVYKKDHVAIYLPLQN